MKNIYLAALLLLPVTILAQPAGFNYDESKVPDYELPVLLELESGKAVQTAEMWKKLRRPEILELFRKHVYGRVPADVGTGIFSVVQEESASALGGIAIRRQVRLYLKAQGEEPFIDVLIYLPKKVVEASGKAPIFTGLNFNGNHSVTTEKEVPVHGKWARNDPRVGHKDNRANEGSRAANVSRWQVEMLINAGFGIATAYYGDIDPDYDDQWKNGIHSVFASSKKLKADEWGSIASWAWGLSRMMDYFEMDEQIDHQRVAVTGLSRLGKTALWAGAEDERFAIVISTDSGCGGAALSRRRYGETVKRINNVFPHWFCDNFQKYDDLEHQLPVDQHMLIALMAPRPVYIASAIEDVWADPKGEFESGRLASPVYELFKKPGIIQQQHPRVNTPVGGTIGYHMRSGDHDANAYDWQQYIKFAKRHFALP